MKETIVFATGNEGKMREVRMILADLGMEILSMKEAGVHADIVEDGRPLRRMQRLKPKRSGPGRAALYWQMILVWQLIIWEESQGFTLPDIWEKILPMILKTRRLLTG